MLKLREELGFNQEEFLEAEDFERRVSAYDGLVEREISFTP